jgi:hypothetical protein
MVSDRIRVEKVLRAVLDQWIEINLENPEGSLLMELLPREQREKQMADWKDLIMRTARETEPHLAEFFKDQSDKTAEQLEELAGNLSPGGVHNGGLLVQIVRGDLVWPNPLLVAAILLSNWHGGKCGFQFMPDPETTDPDIYDDEAAELMSLFDEATNCDPRRILTGDDLAFYDSLPKRFTIYRGCSGIPPERAGAGVCWTTQRDIAEWFALRSTPDREPVVVSARTSKKWVRLAKAVEFEVVTIPASFRQVRCRRSSIDEWRPKMRWTRLAATEAPENEDREESDKQC